MSRLGHLLAFAGLLLVGVALALNTSAWPGAAIATVGALVVVVDSLARWADAESADTRRRRAAEQLDALERRLGSVEEQMALLSARLETAERRDALGRM